MGLKSLYMRIGGGANTRFIPVHKLALTLGERMSINFLKAHIATGCDWISKVGMKNKALAKISLLDEFAEGDISKEMIDKTEEYLCSVLKGKAMSFKTFDNVRYFQYIKSGVPINSIVPSSTCMRNGHIMRMFYLVKRLSSLLNKYFVSLDPIAYAWKEKDGYLLPNKCLREIPNNL